MLRAALLFLIFAAFATSSAANAQTQPGSAGGSIGMRDKSSSGEKPAPASSAPALPPARSSQGAIGGGAITIVSATLGENCGVPAGNVTAKVGAVCNGQETCALPGSAVNNPDPAFGCPKSFSAQWRCGANGKVRSNAVPAVAMEGNILKLSCK